MGGEASQDEAFQVAVGVQTAATRGNRLSRKPPNRGLQQSPGREHLGKAKVQARLRAATRGTVSPSIQQVARPWVPSLPCLTRH